jgi:hypothetical protein
MNPYYFLYYILYKCVKLTTRQDLQHLAAESATNILVFGIINYTGSFLIFTKLIKYFPDNLLLTIVIVLTYTLLVYLLNKRFFLHTTQYRMIESFYDEKTKLKKAHFIIFTFIYMALSISLMVLAGINYR